MISERFQLDMVSKFSLLHPKVVLLPGRDNRSGNHFLASIFTVAKTKCVDSWRSGVARAKDAENLRIWREYGSGVGVKFCFEANCHYVVNTPGMFICKIFFIFLYTLFFSYISSSLYI